MIAPMNARALINTPVPVKLHWKRISDVVVDLKIGWISVIPWSEGSSF